MTKRNKWAVPAAVILSASLLMTACSGSNNSKGNEETGNGSSNSNASNTEQTIRYNILMNGSIPEYPEDGGEGRKLITEAAAKAGATGVDFQVTMGGDGDDYNTKLNLLASSGELPDVFRVDPQTLSTFVDQGLVMPLDDLLKDAPNITSIVPEESFQQATFDGKIYGIPSGVLPEAYNSPNVTGLFVRQDWLDQLGLQTPDTLDQLEEVLKTFKTSDPDGNGKDDTIPFEAHNVPQSDYGFDQIFGAFGIAPQHWQEVDGKIQKGFTLPGTKQALETLQKWYKEGLIDPEFPVLTGTAANAKLSNSKVGVMVQRDFVMNSYNPVNAALSQANPDAKLAVIPAPAGPDGLRGYAAENPSGMLLVFSKDIKDPQRFMKFLNWTATDEGFLTPYGIEGTDYTYDKENNKITQITSTADLYKKGLSNPIRFFFINDRRNTDQPFRDAAAITSKHVIPNELWNSIPAEQDYPDLDSKLWPEYLVKIVTGEWSVDKWDEFVQKYYDQGGKTIEEQANEQWKELNA
ncbi:extracellular solute-binding protein [Paenibacillus sp. HB172176]|uniref:extracellular solute-binding protein n=1 Tax=Paenibacillus sp. HB172176 TaxID=2493690 RepID=UPI00143C4275|nr:extracellular solute-binding protein [Paenibacillus sp. HB172176]